MSKIEGIDERVIKCCDKSETTIEAGISFDNDNGRNILRFHFLNYIEYGKNGKLESPILHQQTKSMWLNSENTKQLIRELRNLRFTGKKRIYLENTDHIGGLLVSVTSSMSSELTFNPKNAKEFNSRKEAKQFIEDNSLQGKYKPIGLDLD